MRMADLIAGAALTLIGVVLIFLVIPAETVPGDEGEIAPALLSTAAMTVIAVLGFLIFLSALRRRPDSGLVADSMAVDWGAVRFFFAVALGLSAAWLAVWALGFVASGILIVIGFALFLLRGIPWRDWRLAVSITLVAVTVPVAIYLLVWHGLRLSLP